VLSLPKFIIKALRYKALTLLAGLFCPMTTGDTGVSAFKSQPAMVVHTIEVIIWHTKYGRTIRKQLVQFNCLRDAMEAVLRTAT